MYKPLTDDKRCPHCGGQDFGLAQDITRYTTIDVVDGELCPIYDDDSRSMEDDAIRFFCLGCSDLIETPRELL